MTSRLASMSEIAPVKFASVVLAFAKALRGFSFGSAATALGASTGSFGSPGKLEIAP